METARNTFIGIFQGGASPEEIRVEKIIIPIIQRDYAQGRMDPDVIRIRTRFLESLHGGITREPIILDFIYGDLDEQGVLTPLDGQQRLTALFLLHWYAAKKEGIPEEEWGFLRNFSYETRYSARDFCSLLLRHTPSFTTTLSQEIIEEAWFPLDWKKDPTIHSMLVMLDAMDEVFKDTTGIWKSLKEGAISFYFLPMQDMDLSDELYIKMNSRGKPLTLFENFKAELERELLEVDKALGKEIIRKVDMDWTDMLWAYRGEDQVIDDEFLRYFRFITDILCYEGGGSPQGKSGDVFDLLKEYFSKESGKALEHARTLEAYFDCWCRLQGEGSLEGFFEAFLSHGHQEGKVAIEKRFPINIFADCLGNYADVTGTGNRTFPLHRIIFLYGVIQYLLNREAITAKQFSRRLRIIHNLIQNSEDEISDSEQRTTGNRFPAILKQVAAIMKTGVIREDLGNGFNAAQLGEEAAKDRWLEAYPEKAGILFAMEDHELLYGQISILGLEHPEYFQRFASLFACDWDLVDCALMAVGPYFQVEQNKWRYQLGSRGNPKAWRKLFHKSGNQRFEETRKVLSSLLSQHKAFDNDLLRGIIQDYLHHCQRELRFPWTYYYIRYEEFRPGSFGKYSWPDYSGAPYEFYVMQTEASMSPYTYNPFLKAVDGERLSKGDSGVILLRNKQHLSASNAGYILWNQETGEMIHQLLIQKDEEGTDREDRILKAREFLKSI